jgi:hypothetical protein
MTEAERGTPSIRYANCGVWIPLGSGGGPPGDNWFQCHQCNVIFSLKNS